MVYIFPIVLTAALYSAASAADAGRQQSILVGFSSNDCLAVITSYISGSTSGGVGMLGDVSSSTIKVSTLARPFVPKSNSGQRKLSKHDNPQQRKLSNDPTIGFVTIDFTNEYGKPVYGRNTDIDAECTALFLFDCVTVAEPNFEVMALEGTLRGRQQEATIRRSLLESRPWGIDMVNVEQLWSLAPKEKVKICIIDTGYDVNHPDLPTVADDGVTGFTPRAISEFRGGGVWSIDGNGHGTHVAGTVGAIGNNGRGVVGTNPDPSKFSFHIAKGLADGGVGFTSGIIDCVQDCVAKGAKVISLSLGSGSFSTLANMAYKDAYDQGALVVAASGNSGQGDYLYPASYESVMSVGSVAKGGGPGSNTYGILSSFSTHNDQVEISAPGSNVFSTKPNNSYYSLSGTSMATPHVSGVAVLLISQFPACTNNQVRNAMLSSVRAPPTVDSKNDEGWDKYYGFGIVDAGAAYELLSKGCEEAGGKYPDIAAGQSLSDMALGGFEQMDIGCINDEQCPKLLNFGERNCNLDTNICFTVEGTAPTPSPTPSPTQFAPCVDGKVRLTVELMTDGFPTETSWTLRSTCSGGEQVAQGLGYTDETNLYKTNYCAQDGRFEFRIEDSFGDGLYWPGYFKVYQDGTLMVEGIMDALTGQETGSSETKTFGSCGRITSANPTDVPTTTNPTKNPTETPSKNPTNVPTTVNPTKNPTVTPTNNPTNVPTTVNPTKNPTVTPTNNPTHIPTTQNPTVNPTNQPTNVLITKTPTKSPMNNPIIVPFEVTIRVDIITDDYPAETRWTLIDTCPGGDGGEVTSGSGYIVQGQLESTETVTRSSRFQFVILDTYGDGICCSHGFGSYKVYTDNELQFSGGEFDANESNFFGECSDGPVTPKPSPNAPSTYPPISRPTSLPTAFFPASNGTNSALYDPILGAPKCGRVHSSGTCTTLGTNLLKGKANSVEQHPPNSLDECSDGDGGVYGLDSVTGEDKEGDESIEAISISASDGGVLMAGSLAKITARVYAWKDGKSSSADFYYATDPENPTWQLISTGKPSSGHVVDVESAVFVLPSSMLQAVRVNFRFAGEPSPCSGGSYDDVDDLVFAVDTTSSAALTSSFSAGPLGTNSLAEQDAEEQKLDCTALPMDRCKAARDVCVWTKKKSSGSIFHVSSEHYRANGSQEARERDLRKKGCFPAE